MVTHKPMTDTRDGALGCCRNPVAVYPARAVDSSRCGQKVVPVARTEDECCDRLRDIRACQDLSASRQGEAGWGEHGV